MSEYIKKDDLLAKAVEVEYLGRPRMMVSVAKIGQQPSIDIVRCCECKWWIDNLTENDDDEAYDSCRWDWSRKIPTADDFCSYGERRA